MPEALSNWLSSPENVDSPRKIGSPGRFNAPSSPLFTASSSMADEEEDARRFKALNSALEYEERALRSRLEEKIGGFAVKLIRNRHVQERAQLSLLALLLSALRRSLLVCKATTRDISLEIGGPTNVRHVTHVTFDRFNGFLGLPIEFQVEIPKRVPSASVSVFGVSAESMQCSYDRKGNSVPTILLLIQDRLYREGGLQAEGIFRINAENSHEEEVRQYLNKGIVPKGVDLHCLAGLIKAWFRELPKGILDSLALQDVMQCSSEEDCVELVKKIPPTESALLNWAVNLMADVVQEEEANKMNARNIAMVFAPNMIQVVEPLTALMHAVQVTNLLKILIMRAVRERQGAALVRRPAFVCAESPYISDFDTDNASSFVLGYVGQERMTDGIISEALTAPFNSPNTKRSPDRRYITDDLGEVFVF